MLNLQMYDTQMFLLISQLIEYADIMTLIDVYNEMI